METELRQLVGRDIAAKSTCVRELRQQSTNEVEEPALRVGDMRIAMQQRNKLGGVLPAPVDTQRIDPKHRLEPGAGITGPAAQRRELLEMPGNVPVVPRDQDRLDVREVLVQRRPTDPGGLRDLGHRDPGQPVLGNYPDAVLLPEKA